MISSAHLNNRLINFISLRVVITLLTLSTLLHANLSLPKDLFYFNELEVAHKQAIKRDRPLVFIIALSSHLQGTDDQLDPISTHPAGAIQYALQSFQERGVLIWVDAETEQKNLPPLVEKALYDEGISFFYPPKVVITTPQIDRIIATVNMTDQIEERQRWTLTAIEKIEDKESWKTPLKTTENSLEKNLLPHSNQEKKPWIFFVLGFILGGITIFILSKINK